MDKSLFNSLIDISKSEASQSGKGQFNFGESKMGIN
ncbi:MAG: hypothetical protein CM15mP109_14820 [Candidatus Dadabacteria bacterium]|nr:MAG: hypothetical protein CM15mP109_14820 [Candidatus Dadabacteria bacterium]